MDNVKLEIIPTNEFDEKKKKKNKHIKMIILKIIKENNVVHAKIKGKKEGKFINKP